MEQKSKRVGRDDWIVAALDVLRQQGVHAIKASSIAKRMGLTTGSFYWHFKNLQDLLDCVLNYWEHEQTDHIIVEARNFTGPPDARILNLMLQVISEDAAHPDHAISVWANSDPEVGKVYVRTIERRFEFAAWMFQEAGFAPEDAAIRGRMMVTSMMGETSTQLKKRDDWKDIVTSEWRLLVNRQADVERG